MCRVCEVMPLNQKYVSPFPKSDDIYSRLSIEEISNLTKDAISAIVASSRRQTESERLSRTGQTALF